MKGLIDKGFNELFLNEMSKFDSHKYAYETFFNCSSERFSKISKFYGDEFGNGAYNYMLSTFYAWKNGRVNPNGSSCYNIIASAASTFTVEEKFVEAYTQLAKHIKNGFQKKISVQEVNKTFEQIIDRIETFNLEKTSYYAKYIFKGDELVQFQLYVQTIFKFYTKTIFENLNADVELFLKIYKNINTSFLSTHFSTYLFNIEIDINNLLTNKVNIKKVFELEHSISFENLYHSKIGKFSLDQVSQIAKAKISTSIDAFLSELEIEKIVSRKMELESLNQKGTITMNVKTNSGRLYLRLRILSPSDKIILHLRVIGFIIAISILTYYCFILTFSFFIFIIGIFVSQYIISSNYKDIINLYKDIFKLKS